MSEGDESGRRIVSIVHLAMIATLPLYIGILWIVAGHAPFLRMIQARPRLPETLLAIGGSEWLAATVVGRILLKAGRGRKGAAQRVRRFFLIRIAAAEAIAVFGLFAGFTGSAGREYALLFAASAFALIASTPTRSAWQRASSETAAAPLPRLTGP